MKVLLLTQIIYAVIINVIFTNTMLFKKNIVRSSNTFVYIYKRLRKRSVTLYVLVYIQGQ